MSPNIDLHPLEIKKSVEPGERYVETLKVRNVGEDRYAYEVRAERAYRAWVDPDPERFAINARDDLDVTLKLLPPRDAKIGLHLFQIVVTNDEDEADTAHVDVALRVPIPALWWATATALVLLVILLIVLWQTGAF